jgi:hypothetical protein
MFETSVHITRQPDARSTLVAWEYSDVVRWLGNATLDGGLFPLVQNGLEALLHAAEAQRICEDGPDVRCEEVIGWIIARSQPYVNVTSDSAAPCR